MNAAKRANSHVGGQGKLDPQIADIEKRRHPGHFSVGETLHLRKTRVPLKNPACIFFEEAESAVLPCCAGPLDVPHGSAADENLGAAAEQEDFDDRAGLEVDAALAEKSVRTNVLGGREQVESLSADARADQFENDFEANSVIAAALRLRAVDRLFDRGFELVEIEGLL